jgi:hypothetical protein
MQHTGTQTLLRNAILITEGNGVLIEEKLVCYPRSFY